MVERTALEMRHTGNRIGGSNPSLSAKSFWLKRNNSYTATAAVAWIRPEAIVKDE